MLKVTRQVLVILQVFGLKVVEEAFGGNKGLLVNHYFELLSGENDSFSAQILTKRDSPFLFFQR